VVERVLATEARVKLAQVRTQTEFNHLKMVEMVLALTLTVVAVHRMLEETRVQTGQLTH
jgi:hypothetical protein